MKPGWDPQLKAAMAEVEALLKRYDIGGHVVLASRTHVEFKWFLETPSWSLVEKNARGYLFKYRGKSNPLDSEATGGLVLGVRDELVRAFGLVDDLAKLVEPHYLHTPQNPIGPRPVPPPEDK